MLALLFNFGIKVLKHPCFLQYWLYLCCQAVAGIKFVGVRHPKHMHGFSPTFQDSLALEDLELIKTFQVIKIYSSLSHPLGNELL